MNQAQHEIATLLSSINDAQLAVCAYDTENSTKEKIITDLRSSIKELNNICDTETLQKQSSPKTKILRLTVDVEIPADASDEMIAKNVRFLNRPTFNEDCDLQCMTDNYEVVSHSISNDSQTLMERWNPTKECRMIVMSHSDCESSVYMVKVKCTQKQIDNRVDRDLAIKFVQKKYLVGECTAFNIDGDYRGALVFDSISNITNWASAPFAN